MKAHKGLGLRKLSKNVMSLACGQAAGAGLEMLALVVIARGLGLEAFGAVVVIQTFVRTVDALVNFQSWQALIKYGAEDREAGRFDQLRRLVKTNLLLDASTAALAFVATMIGMYWVANGVGLESTAEYAAAFAYGLVILCNLSGTTIGVLRLAGRFFQQSIAQTLGAVVKLVGVSVAAVCGAPLWVYLLVWAAGDALIYLGLTWYAWRATEQLGIGSPRDVLAASPKGVRDEHGGVVKYLVMTNLNSSVKLAVKELDVLVLAALVSPAASGLLKVAKTIARVLGQVARPVEQGLYPELATAWAQHDRSKMLRLAVMVSLGAGVAGLAMAGVFALIGRPALELVFGQAYGDAFAVTLLFFVGSSLFLFGLPLPGVLATIGAVTGMFIVQLACNGIYLASLPWLIDRFGVEGAGWGKVLYQTLWLLGYAVLVAWSLKRIPANAEAKQDPPASIHPGPTIA